MKNILLLPKNGNSERTRRVLQALTLWLPKLSDETWSLAGALRDATLQWLKENNYTNKEALWPLRVALSGSATSPDVFALAHALGREKTMQRIQHALTI